MNILIFMISVRIHFNNRMEALSLLIDRHIKRIENEENNDLVEIYHLFYDVN